MARPREFDEAEAVRRAGRTFWTHGYQATSIRDLEAATGLVAGSLYKAFGSKRELFLLCLEQYMKEESYLALLLKLFDTPFEEALRRIFDLIIDSASDRSQRPAGCLATNLVAELLNVDPELGDAAAAGLAEMHKALKFRLKWAVESGDIPAGRDVGVLASYLMVVIQGMLLLSTSTKDVEAMRAARDMAIKSLH
ncbi:TetR/AcrR family transcriptional regulator [Methylibium petroleiphilum]|uniref:TetR/AcrR family transcriptional regulator n=1 Tax=Methylibium petroleiphilum TaxID=105560 RepID=UPI001AD2B83A|nr:TetR/AcrR family transcriptional regulator [Methylibium petroleiphilum]MBN9206924.1 TetR/AcrR family transcriptional regulator [Methylibium petroleiphilum]